MNITVSFDPYDTVMFILDNYSRKVINELEEVKNNDQKLAEKKKDILLYFTKVLDSEQDLSAYLSKYFESMGFEKDFNHSIEISNLDIIGKDTFNIYMKDSFMNRRTSAREEISSDLKGSKSSILVY